MHRSALVAPLLAAFLLASPVAAQTVLILDDTNGVTEAFDAADRLGFEVVNTRNLAGFLVEFEAREEWDVVVIDIARLVFTSALLEALSTHLDAGGAAILSYANLDGFEELRDVVQVDCTGNPEDFRFASTPDDGIDLFAFSEVVPSPLIGTDRGYSDSGDLCESRGESLVFARFGDPGGAPAIYTSRDNQILVNGALFDVMREAPGVAGGDGDDDGVRDLVELIENELLALLDLQTAALVVYADGPTPALDRMATELELDVLRPADLAELDALIADDDYHLAYLALSDLAAADVGLQDRIDALRAGGTPVVFLSPDFDAAPAWATYFGISVGDDDDVAESVVPGPAGLERVLFQQPEVYAGLAVTDPAPEDSRDAITDAGAFQILGRFGTEDGPIAVVGDPDGGLVVGSFTLAELGNDDGDDDGLSASTEFLTDARAFSREIGPVAVLVTDARPEGLASELAEAANAFGYYALRAETGADAAATLGVTTPEIVLVENVGADGSTFDDPAFVAAVQTHVDGGGSLVITAADFDAMPNWRGLLGIETAGDLTSPRVLERDQTHLGRIFAVPDPTPASIAAAPLERTDHGDELRLTGVGSVVARFAGGAPAVATVHNGRTIANGFVSQAIGQEDTDRDRLRDVQQLLRAEIHAVLTPQQTLLLDDDDSRPSVIAEAAQRAGLSVVRVTDAPGFVAAFDGGGFQQMAVDSSMTDTVVDPDVWSRLTTWGSETRGMTIAYTNFDAHPDAAADLGLTAVDASGREAVVEGFDDETEVFRSPARVPNPLARGAAIYADGGDELTLVDGGQIAGRFGHNFGPGAVALGPTGTTAVNGFAPRELASVDLNSDGIADPVALLSNQMVRTGRVPVPAVAGPFELVEGRSLTLDASASFDPFGEPLAFAWDLDDDGDFDDAAGATIALDGGALDGPSSLSVALRVTNDSGLRAITRIDVDVLNAEPTVSAGGDRTVDQGRAAIFTAIVGDVPDDTWFVEWDFGDGEGAVGDSTTHMYAELGVYDASVTVTDDDGGVALREFTVTYRNLPPLVVVEPHPPIDEGGEATFRAEVTDPGDDTFAVTWEFGDGGRAGGLEVRHLFADDGTYAVTATALDENDGSTTDGISFRVENVPPEITTEPPTIAAADAEYAYDVEVTDPGADEITYELEEGPPGMTVDVDGRVRWTPPSTGFEDITVRLVVRDDDGGSDTQEWTITISFGDRDLGGAPDTCETSFGFDPDDPADDESDPDGDGLTVAEECITGRDPTVFSGPGAPVLLSPIEAESWSRPFVEFELQNAVDPDGDPLVYDFQLFEDDELTTLFAEAIDVDEVPTGTTMTVFVEEFVEDHVYSWRARGRAVDVTGPWSEPERFVFNMRNAPPGRPAAVSPVGYATENPPTLLIDNSVDPELEALTYDFDLYRGNAPQPEALLWALEDVPEGSGGQTSVEVDLELEEGFQYTWRVRAKDGGAPPGRSPYELAQFTLDSSNAPPTAPEPVSPIDGAEVPPGASTLLTWSNSEDPDDDRVRYFGDIATDADFTSVVRPFAADEDPANTTTAVLVTLALEPERTYYWRVGASDGRSTTEYGYGDFVTASPFFNTPPTAPTPVSPLAGATRPPSTDVELIVDNATDPDGNPITYQFQVALDVEMRTLAFEAVEVDEGQDTTSVIVENLNPFDYFWRARATDGVDPGRWSAVNGFTVESDRVRPPDDAGFDAGLDAGFEDVGDPGPPRPTSGRLGGGGGCASAPGTPATGPWAALCVLLGTVALRRRRTRRQHSGDLRS